MHAVCAEDHRNACGAAVLCAKLLDEPDAASHDPWPVREHHDPAPRPGTARGLERQHRRQSLRCAQSQKSVPDAREAHHEPGRLDRTGDPATPLAMSQALDKSRRLGRQRRLPRPREPELARSQQQLDVAEVAVAQRIVRRESVRDRRCDGEIEIVPNVGVVDVLKRDEPGEPDPRSTVTPRPHEWRSLRHSRAIEDAVVRPVGSDGVERSSLVAQRGEGRIGVPRVAQHRAGSEQRHRHPRRAVGKPGEWLRRVELRHPTDATAARRSVGEQVLRARTHDVARRPTWPSGVQCGECHDQTGGAGDDVELRVASDTVVEVRRHLVGDVQQLRVGPERPEVREHVHRTAGQTEGADGPGRERRVTCVSAHEELQPRHDLLDGVTRECGVLAIPRDVRGMREEQRDAECTSVQIRADGLNHPVAFLRKRKPQPTDPPALTERQLGQPTRDAIRGGNAGVSRWKRGRRPLGRRGRATGLLVAMPSCRAGANATNDARTTHCCRWRSDSDSALMRASDASRPDWAKTPRRERRASSPDPGYQDAW